MTDEPLPTNIDDIKLTDEQNRRAIQVQQLLHDKEAFAAGKLDYRFTPLTPQYRNMATALYEDDYY
eukprot:UN08721